MTSSTSRGRADRLVKINKVLGAVALVLVALSAFAYYDSVRRAERFERGQKFLPNLNPDEVMAIELEKGDETTRLRREGDRFVVVSEGRYPASNDSVNRLVRDVLDLSLEKKIGAGAGLADELGLGDDTADTLEIAFQDEAGKDMVRFRVGDQLDGGGSYLKRTDEGADDTIFLASSRVFLNADGASYVDKQIVDAPQSEVERIAGGDFEIARGEESNVLELADVPEGKQGSSSKISQLGTLLSGLRFTAHHLADSTEVTGLSFDQSVEVVLKDGSGYLVEVATRDEKHFLRISGFHTAGRIEVAMDASEEEVRESSEVLVRADEVTAFNTLHGSWVYEVAAFTANKVRLVKKDLIEDA